LRPYKVRYEKGKVHPVESAGNPWVPTLLQEARRVIYKPPHWGEDGKEQTMGIHKELLNILACPKCKGELRLTEDENGLICDACRLLYEIRDEIPILLIDEAVPID